MRVLEGVVYGVGDFLDLDWVSLVLGMGAEDVEEGVQGRKWILRTWIGI